MKRIKQFLTREYNLLNSLKSSLTFVALLFVLLYIFMYVFMPFGLYSLPQKDIYILIAKYIGYPLIIWFIVLYLLSSIIKSSYTIFGTMMLMLLLLVISGLTTHFIWADYFNYRGLNSVMLYNSVLMSVYIGFMPITLVVVFHSNYKLSSQIKEMLQLNDSIADNIQKTDICCNITILSREQNKEYKIDSESIIYVQSQDNYIKVITVDNDDIKLELIRTTLGYAERDIRKDCSHIIRCHNSYIVNLNNVKRVEGNSAGYKLQLKDSSDVIPVSRKYAGDVKAYFSTK